MTTTDGVSLLASATLGRTDIQHRCVGYIRNVVPVRDENYPHPVPWAHVPVFAPIETAEPRCEGSWLALASAGPDLVARHWWPIVEHHLTARESR